MRSTLVFLFLVVLAGCADTHEIIRTGATVKLSREASAYVGISKDGAYGSALYSGSGAMAAQAVAKAFGPYLSRVTVGKRENLDNARKSAQAGGYTYLLYPEILHWEDRATEWSGIPDQVSVKVSVLNADTGAVLDSAVVTGKSGLGTVGGDRPEHLLPKPLSEYAATLFK